MIQRRQNLYLALMVILSLILSFSSYTIAELELDKGEIANHVISNHLQMDYSSNHLYNKKEQVSTSVISTAKVQYDTFGGRLHYLV